MPARLRPDPWLLGAALGLVSIGVVMVLSSSGARSGDPSVAFRRQGLAALAGLVLGWLATRFDYRRLARWRWGILAVGAVLLGLVLLPFVGLAHGGARRWLPLAPGLTFQPVEFAKVALVVYLAAFLARRCEAMGDFRRSFLPPLTVAVVFALLVLRQPDLGNCVTLLAVAAGMIFLAGAPLTHLAGLLAVLVPALGLAVWWKPYRFARVLTFLAPDRDPQGAGWQASQSVIAIGSGGLLGHGPGQSQQKFFLPEGHTDFIFALLAEEVGLAGALVVVGVFAVLVWRGLRAGLRAPDAFGSYLALGLTLLIAVQALVNMGVVTLLLPTKGLPLPYVSYGGTALVVTLGATGLLLNVSQHARA